MSEKPTYNELEKRVRNLENEKNFHKQAEKARTSHLRYFESIERVNHVIRQAADVEQVLSDVLQVVLNMFEADRAWLLYPCDPEAESWSVQMERTRPEYPGAFALGEEVPMLPEIREVVREALDKDDVITIDYRSPDTARETAGRFSTMAEMHMAVHPRTGSPWVFGVHQCSHYRDWTGEERDLFREIGRRLGDALSTLLALRDLRESKEKYRRIFENLQDVYYEAGIDGIILEVSPSIERLSQYKRDELTGKSLYDIYTDPKERDEFVKLISDTGKVNDYEIYLKDKDGTQIPCSITTALVRDNQGVPVKLIGSMRNISEKKQAEKISNTLFAVSNAVNTTRNLKDLYRSIHHSLGNVIDVANFFIALVDSKERTLHFPYHVDTTDDDFFPIINFDPDESLTGLVVSRRRPVLLKKKELEERAGHDGVWGPLPLIWMGAPLIVKDEVIGVIAVQSYMDSNLYEKQDLQILSAVSDQVALAIDRKRSEDELRHSEARYRLFVEESLQGLVIAQDNPVRLSFVSKPMEAITGYSREDLKNFGPQQLMELIHPEDRETFFKKFRDRLAGKEVPSMYECRIIHKEKGIRWVEIYSSRIEYKGIPATHTIFLDITERTQAKEALRESEEKLARSKKMESLGLLAGGVAHDLNNVLSGIVSYPELILMDLPEESKLRKPVETIMESGNRAAAIVQDLLTVARGVATAKEPLSLNDMVSDYLISPELNKLKQFQPAVTIKTSLDGDLLNVKGSEVHIRKVVMNLTSNAAEAVEGSGSVTISTMNRYLDRPVCGYSEVSIGEYAVLAVSDDGPGISPDDLKKIFEPFYTKKVMGRSGTGLGLAVVWNTMQDHDGYIDVKSDENGTTFELYFPITRDEISDKDLSIPLEDFKGNKETILVVDDVKTQREISCKMLDMLGYITIAVSSGEEAVEYLKENRVDLVLLDMIMDPGINGRETYERIIKIHPGQKAVIISGFADTDEVKKARRAGAGQYIKKPVTLEKLGLAVKEELGE